MIKNLCNVFIFVKDQNKAKEFWSKKMGFKIKEDIQIEGKYTWTEVIPQEGTTSLVLYPKSLRTDSKKSYKEITFFTDDIQSTYNDFYSLGNIANRGIHTTMFIYKSTDTSSMML